MRAEPAETPAPDPAPAVRRRRRRWPWFALLLLLLLLVGLRAALPFALERGVAWASRHYLGLPARLSNADFELWKGRVTLDGIAVGRSPDAAAPIDAALHPPAIEPGASLLRVRRISAQLGWRDLFAQRLHLTELHITGPRLRLVRESDGSIDPLRHARPVHQPAAEPMPVEPAAPSPWTFALDRFELREPNLKLLDAGDPEALAALSFERFGLDGLKFVGGEIELAGVDLEGPVFQVRRELLRPGTGERAASAEAAPDNASAPERSAVTPTADATTAAKGAGNAPPAPAPEPVAAGGAAQSSSPENPPEDPAHTAAAAPTDRSAPPEIRDKSKAQRKSGARHRISKLAIERATFRIVTDQGPLDVAFTLDARGVNTEEGRSFPLRLAIEIGEGKLSLDGEVGLLPPNYRGRLAWEGLPIPRLLLASLPQFAGWLRQAQSNADLQVDADPGGLRGDPALRISGRLAFDELAVSDPEGTEIRLGWKKLAVVASEVFAPLPVEGEAPGTTRAKLESVELIEPAIRYTRPSPQLDALLGLNLSGGATLGEDAGDTAGSEEVAVAEPAPAEPAKEEPAAGALELEIATLAMHGGQIEAIDRMVDPQTSTRIRIRKLELAAQDVRLPEPAASRLRFTALLPIAARLKVEGALGTGRVGDFRLELDQLELPVFNPYAGLAGVRMNRGNASVDAKIELRGPAMKIDNRLTLGQLDVELREPGSFERQFGVPIDLALALLRDAQGDIALRIPIEVDESGAQVKLGAVVASALRAALLGALSAPFKMLGAVFAQDEGPHGGAIDPILCAAGTTDFLGDASERLDGMVEVLLQRPMVALMLTGSSGREDRPYLAEKILLEDWQAGRDLPDVKGDNFLSRRRIAHALEARAAGAEPELDEDDQKLLARYIDAVDVPRERLLALGRARAEAVRDQLLARDLPPGQVQFADPDPESEPRVSIGFGARPTPLPAEPGS